VDGQGHGRKRKKTASQTEELELEAKVMRMTELPELVDAVTMQICENQIAPVARMIK
jgi:hypothetical protein